MTQPADTQLKKDIDTMLLGLKDWHNTKGKEGVDPVIAKRWIINIYRKEVAAAAVKEAEDRFELTLQYNVDEKTLNRCRKAYAALAGEVASEYGNKGEING